MPQTIYNEFVARQRYQRGIFTMVLKWRRKNIIPHIAEKSDEYDLDLVFS